MCGREYFVRNGPLLGENACRPHRSFGAEAAATASTATAATEHSAARRAASAQERVDDDAAEDGAHHVAAAAPATEESVSAGERPDVVLRQSGRLGGEVVGALSELERLFRRGRREAACLHDEGAGFGQARPCFHADGAAAGCDEVLRRRYLGTGLRQQLVELVRCALGTFGLISYARNERIDLGVR